MKKFSIIIGFLFIFWGLMLAQKEAFSVQVDFKTGGIQKIMNPTDPDKMNWIFASQT